MAAPSHTALPTTAAIQAAGGIQLPRGGTKAVIVFNRLPTAYFWCQKVKPGKITGKAIPQTTQLNLAVHTKAGGALAEYGDITAQSAYDPALRSQIINTLLQQNGSCTAWWPDGSYEDFYGMLIDADFAELEIDTLPMVTLTVAYTNYDPINHVEVAPVFTSVAGT